MILWKNYFLIKSSINIDFKELIKSSKYEILIGELMNKSEIVFPHKYIHQEDQSSGQCDFVDSTTGDKFDAKFPLNKGQGKSIGSNNGDVGNFTKIMYQEALEFKPVPGTGSNRDLGIANLTLYSIMKNLILRTARDEHIIYFIPYPIVYDFEGFPLCGITDILKAIYRQLNKELSLGNKQIYAIYVGFDKKIVLRNLGTDKREYLQCNELLKYVAYDVHFPE